MSSKKCRIINYYDLPIDFWDEVIYYEYFYSHSGFIETKPHVEIWTMEGKAIDGYRFYQRHEYDRIYWIREDVYKENYNNVIEKMINYSDNEQYLSGPLCVCAENT